MKTALIIACVLLLAQLEGCGGGDDMGPPAPYQPDTQPEARAKGLQQ